MAKWMQNPAISGDAGKVLMGDQKAALYLALNSGWAETTAPIGGVTPPPDSALDLEQVRDAIALALRGLGGITIEPDDPGDTIGIRQKNKLADLADVDQGGAATGKVPAVTGTNPVAYGLRTLAELGAAAYTDEQAQDAAAALLAAGTHTGIAFVYDDAGNKLSATVTGSSSPPTTIAARTLLTTGTADDTQTYPIRVRPPEPNRRRLVVRNDGAADIQLAYGSGNMADRNNPGGSAFTVTVPPRSEWVDAGNERPVFARTATGLAMTLTVDTEMAVA